MRKYEIGSIINDKWIIVSILQVRKQNKKLLCFNLYTYTFTEGWIWDFTRDLISNNKPTKNPICVLTKTYIPYGDLLTLHQEYVYKVYIYQQNLSREDFFILRDIREGWYKDVKSILKKFDLLLATSGQARRNKPLAMVIGLTYIILAMNKYFKGE